MGVGIETLREGRILVPARGCSLAVLRMSGHSLGMMAGVERVVSASDIAAARLSLRDVYELVLEGLALHGRGQYECPPKIGIHTRPGAFMHAMPAYLPTKGIAGTKLISVYPDNPAHGLPATTGVIVMMDPDSGIPHSVVDAAWVTGVRTAMVSMADVTFLANPDPVIGIVGATGATGRAHIEAIATVFPRSRVLVGSRSQERLTVLLTNFASLPCELIPAGSDEVIVRESDVVIVCTAHLPAPILKAQWLHPGHNVLNVHSRGWAPDILTSVGRVSCDDRRPITDPHSGLLSLYPDLDPDIELGEVVIGSRPGRETPEQIIFSFNYGLAIFDILVTDYVLRNL